MPRRICEPPKRGVKREGRGAFYISASTFTLLTQASWAEPGAWGSSIQYYLYTLPAIGMMGCGCCHTNLLDRDSGLPSDFRVDDRQADVARGVNVGVEQRRREDACQQMSLMAG